MKDSAGNIEKKRFIAGAVCPACKALDTVFTYLKDGTQWRGCAQCDMHESFSAFSAAQEELPTRVNRHRVGEPALAHETPTEAVVLVDISRRDVDGVQSGKRRRREPGADRNQGQDQDRGKPQT